MHIVKGPNKSQVVKLIEIRFSYVNSNINHTKRNLINPANKEDVYIGRTLCLPRMNMKSDIIYWSMMNIPSC